ncbi:MAG TPA: hypothetical protein VIH72_13620 [Candidatus Acidoferrales bacterium]
MSDDTLKEKISRRDILKNAAAGATIVGLSGLSPLPHSVSAAMIPMETASPSLSSRVLPLMSTSDIYVPPRGRGFMKFSFDFAEPSILFEGLRFSFRIYTFENAYAMDGDLMTVADTPDGGIELTCTGLVWAGGQEKTPARLTARFRRNGTFIEWNIFASMDQPIKSVAAIVRDVPRGKISAGGGTFFDTRDDEILLGYPFGGGALNTARGMDSPLAVIQQSDHDFFFLSVLDDKVRANRFYFQPGEKGYRVELIHEREGWQKDHFLQSPTWRAGHTQSAEDAFRPHYEHVEKTFKIPEWEKREDVPAWFRKIDLALAIHGAHWTGYIFNDYAKMLKILQWTATQIPAENVLVFLAAWDGRYYWNYPMYKADPRMGGEDGLRNLIQKGQALGFRFMPMFGMNSANRELPVFPRIADASTNQIDGDQFSLNWVDWDNDRHFEGWGAYMNLGVDSWRRFLGDRISDVITRYHADAYFLDIAGGWENNTKADMHAGTRGLISDLQKRHPGVMACGEMSYDALMSLIPVYQIGSPAGYPPAFNKYSRSFQHLSHPAPGRGSSGVHESGFSRFDPQTLSLSQTQIPTITIVDDTFDRYRDVMAEIIVRAKQRAGLA